MYDENPLFGEKSPLISYGEWACIACALFLVFYCTIIGVVFGFLNQVYGSVLFVVFLWVITATFIVGYVWYFRWNPDPKFKFYLLLVGILIFCGCVVINVYVWQEFSEPGCKKQHKMHCASGLVVQNLTKSSVKHQQCAVSNGGDTVQQCVARGPAYCISMTVSVDGTYNWFCKNCNTSNTTTLNLRSLEKQTKFVRPNLLAV